MPTHIEVAFHIVVLVLDQEIRESSDIKLDVIASVPETTDTGRQDPLFGPDGTSFQLLELFFTVPG